MKKLSLLFLSLFVAAVGVQADSFKGDICKETCAETAKTEVEGCAKAFETCSTSCPTGWAGKACMIPCKASRTTCERKVGESQTKCSNACVQKQPAKT
jgi:hypothetical protein